MTEIVRWLDELGLSRYAATFVENDIDLDVLPHLSDADLRELGLSLGHRRKLQNALRSQSGPANAVASISAEVADSAGSEAELRHLTVMFCDLVASTKLASRLGPEAYRDVLAEFQSAVVRAIRQFDGYVARYMGDGLLAYFGYPRAHEDDAERAVRAGLSVVGAVRGLTPAVDAELRVRVGIATGEVLAGDIVGEGSAEERAVVGDAPNLAARLQARAEPDEVMISDHTRRLTGRLFVCEATGPHRLKGFSRPQRAWKVIAANAGESRFAAIRGSQRSPLVGRDTEMLLLLERWERARDAEGQVVLLSGEPGIGKSRLTDELRTRITPSTLEVLQYQCSPHYVNSAFHPFIEQIRSAAGLGGVGTTAEKLTRLEQWYGEPAATNDDVRLLASLLSISADDRYPSLDLNAQQQKAKTIEALVARVGNLAARGPLLLIVEDVHWADPTTLEVLGGIVGSVAGQSVLAVMTHRPDFSPPWHGHGHVTAHSLSRLGRRQVPAIVEGVAGGKALPDTLLEEIVVKTDGVPLFVEELTKAVLEAEFLTDGGDRYVLEGPLPRLSVPSTLQDSLAARLDRSPEGKKIAQVAATIGREFSFGLLAAVSALDESSLSAALGQLEEAELIYRRGNPPQADYSFKHALVQDAAYGSLPARRREQLHAELASVLESRFPETVAQQPELLAHHHTEAQQGPIAIGYRQRAAQNALARSAYLEALSHLDLAVGLLESIEQRAERRRHELELQVARGGALMATRGYPAAETEAALSRARALADELGDQRQAFAALRGLHGVYFVRAELETALKAAQEVLATARAGGDTQPLSLAHRLVGQTLCMQGQLAPAREHLEQALGLDAEPRSEKVAPLLHGGGHRLMAPAFLSHVLWLQGYPDQALNLAESGLLEAEQRYGVFTVTAAMFFLGWVRGWRGDYDVVSELAERQMGLAAEHGVSEWTFEGELLADWEVLAEGTARERSDLARQKLASVRGSSGLRAPFRLGLLAEALGSKRIAAGQEVIDEALDLTERTGERWSEAELLRIKAVLLKAAGATADDVEACYRRALAVARRQGARSWELRIASELARLWNEGKSPGKAVTLLESSLAEFSEGFDTLDLRRARELLEAMRSD